MACHVSWWCSRRESNPEPWDEKEIALPCQGVSCLVLACHLYSAAWRASVTACEGRSRVSWLSCHLSCQTARSWHCCRWPKSRLLADASRDTVRTQRRHLDCKPDAWRGPGRPHSGSGLGLQRRSISRSNPTSPASSRDLPLSRASSCLTCEGPGSRTGCGVCPPSRRGWTTSGLSWKRPIRFLRAAG